MSAEETLARFDEKAIDAIFAHLDQCHAPGAAVAIAIGGVPVYRKGFGLANVELPTLLSTTIRMRIGSTTKHFACLAYMLLCEDGRAGIDDPVERHIPEVNAAMHGITMRQLMTHTGGQRDMLAATLLTNGLAAPVTDAEMIACYGGIGTVDFAPGTAWSYNNGGYMLLAAAIERIAGQSLDEVLRERVFLPACMHDTMLRRWDRDFVPNSATLHMVDARGAFVRDTMAMELTAPGGVVSTMDDMLRWLRQLDAPVVGSAETWAAMRTPQRLASGHCTGYGLGLMTVPYRGVETLTHGGNVVGGNSQMIKVPAAALDISIAVNRADALAADLANKVIDLLVDGLEPEWDQTGVTPGSGLYLSPASGRVVELSARGTTQLFSLDGSAPMPVERDPEGALHLPPIARFLQTTFTPGVGGGRLVEFGGADWFDGIEPDREARLGDRAGVYRSAELMAEVRISDGEGGARFEVVGRHGRTAFTLAPLTETIWRAAGTGVMASNAGIVTFMDDAFEITFTRLKRVRFVRA